ncbi:hypothetical protein F3J40_10825 [Pantoea sp. Acro-835]|uniref:RHS protein conserved region domain-containing protein n=2 Tax=Candidatus Pantoea multigeneris TaxID=2608357 RepID=A0ABX0RCQ5_9GAMM|nr:hypothetical protein [Pantoea multigeneris]
MPDRAREYTRIYWYHTRPDGTPEQLSDSNGEEVWRIVNDAWGRVDTAWGEINSAVVREDNLRMQGQYLDRETGLHYNLFRYYDADSMHFISPDPIGLLGGANLYQYAPNPLNWIDPWGLEKCMGVGESGHHVPSVRKSKGRPFEVARSDKTRPTLFPRGPNPEHDHWRMHDAEREFVGPRQGDFLGSEKELFEAYRNAY